MKWEELQKLADDKSVHEALEGFSNDPTGDAGVLVVRAVVEALALNHKGEELT